MLVEFDGAGNGGDASVMSESDELQVLALVADRLDAAGLGYMVTGSMALSYYAVPRMTRDVDLVVEIGERDVDVVIDLFDGDFYVDADAVRAAITDRSSFNLIHSTLLVKVDMLMRKDSEYRRTEFDRRRRVSYAGRPFYIVAPEDLIISKLDWARDTRSETQRSDARNLLRMVADLDYPYLRRWIARLGLEPLYRELLP
jgi:hypothetical protein